MPSTEDLRSFLRTRRGASAKELCAGLGISQPSLSRLVARAGDDIVALGRGRRTRYALARAVRGLPCALPVFQVLPSGRAENFGVLRPIHPEGFALAAASGIPWPLLPEMRDGLFEGLPYFLLDARPQGFLGRNFARVHSPLLQVPDDPTAWTDDDVLVVLALAGEDLPGNLIVGEVSYRRFASAKATGAAGLDDRQIAVRYPQMAQLALEGGAGGSSAGGEFPKFTAIRQDGGALRDVIVKFSGGDAAPAARRWSDLLICEALAAEVIEDQLSIPAARSATYAFAGRTFLEVTRFDRSEHWGRSPACTIGGVGAALLGSPDPRWDRAASALAKADVIAAATEQQIVRLFLFGELIGNTDMHGANLAVMPRDGRLELAPAYDMLPMMYAPLRGGELPQARYAPALPLPQYEEGWKRAAGAAAVFWERASEEAAISPEFRVVARANAEALSRVRRMA